MRVVPGRYTYEYVFRLLVDGGVSAAEAHRVASEVDRGNVRT